MNVPTVPLSRAAARNTSPLAKASTLTTDPGLDWRKVFKVEIAAIDLLERFLAPPHVCERPRLGDVLILEERVIFTHSL
jgi:hypothetical protein